MAKPPRVCIVSPAAAVANNGNWHTAARWQMFLAPVAQVEIALAWDGAPIDALIALHARRSAASIAHAAAADPALPIALVLTGTDLYRDIDHDASAMHSLECASHVVVLQDEGPMRLAAATRVKTRVIVQSAPRRVRHDQPRDHTLLVAVGHLRDEKDPLTLMHAARLLPAGAAIRIVHIGDALDASFAEAAAQTAAACPHYRWLGGLPQAEARRWIARAHALVHTSRMEGGANVVIEALRSRVPVLASRIAGNLGLLGRGYAGCFEPGDAVGLAALMVRLATDRAFGSTLAAQCAEREPRFTPEAERRAVRRLLADMLKPRQ